MGNGEWVDMCQGSRQELWEVRARKSRKKGVEKKTPRGIKGVIEEWKNKKKEAERGQWKGRKEPQIR